MSLHQQSKFQAVTIMINMILKHFSEGSYSSNSRSNSNNNNNSSKILVYHITTITNSNSYTTQNQKIFFKNCST
jgi:hypothetical protein